MCQVCRYIIFMLADSGYNSRHPAAWLAHAGVAIAPHTCPGPVAARRGTEKLAAARWKILVPAYSAIINHDWRWHGCLYFLPHTGWTWSLIGIPRIFCHRYQFLRQRIHYDSNIHAVNTAGHVHGIDHV